MSVSGLIGGKSDRIWMASDKWQHLCASTARAATLKLLADAEEHQLRFEVDQQA
jgi:hypothetical protein